MKRFARRRPCTVQERSRFVAHMRKNHETGGWLIDHYEQGCPLTRDVVVGPEELTGLNSFFRSIDGVVSARRTGRQHFTIREALDLLEAPERQSDSDVSRRHGKIVAFQEILTGPASNPMVTIVEFADDLVVVDGNHTAMAALLYANNHVEFALPVYILAVPSSVSDLG